jgi:hypothetical protein
VAGSAIGGPAGGQIAGALAQRVLREAEMMGDFEYEGDPEAELESMGVSPTLLAEMHNLAELAAEAETEEEADGFIGAIASLASSVLPSLLGGGNGEAYYEDEYEFEEEGDPFFPLLPLAASVLPSVLPMVSKGIQAVGKVLSKAPVKQVMRTLPKIATDVVRNVASQAGAGRPINKKTVVQAVGKATASALANKRAVANAVRPSPGVMRSGALRRCRPTRRPTGQAGYRAY